MADVDTRLPVGLNDDIDIVGKKIKVQRFFRNKSEPGTIRNETLESTVGICDGYATSSRGCVIYLRGVGAVMVDFHQHYAEIFDIQKRDGMGQPIS